LVFFGAILVMVSYLMYDFNVFLSYDFVVVLKVYK